MADNVTLGFAGLGSMGSAMAPHLLEAGYKVVGFDVNQASVDEFVGKGGEAAADLAELGTRADIVFLSLPTPTIVESAAAELAKGSPRAIVDLSTIGPRMSQQVAKLLAAQGVAFVDAPVSGGRGGALAGTLALMVACSDELWEEVSPLLGKLGKIFHVGNEPGQAQVMKLVNNVLSVSALAATCEGMTMGVKAGLDPQVMLDVINASSGRNSATVDKFPRSVLPRTFDFGFATALSLKDMGLGLDEAGAMGVPMIVGTAARTMLQLTMATQGQDSDFTEMAKMVEGWAGVKIGG